MRINWLGGAGTTCFLSDKGGPTAESKRFSCWTTDAATAVAAPPVATLSMELADESASLARLGAGGTLVLGESANKRSTLVSI